MNDNKIHPPTTQIEKRRAETDKAFAEIKEQERTARLEKTMRLRRMRLVIDSPERRPT